MASKYIKKSKTESDLPMKNMRESRYNMYASQQICSARDFSMEEYYEENKSKQALQILYDIGCAMHQLSIIDRNDGAFVINPNFGDYDAWKDSQDVVNNCNFLAKMGHPLYQ